MGVDDLDDYKLQHEALVETVAARILATPIQLDSDMLVLIAVTAANGLFKLWHHLRSGRMSLGDLTNIATEIVLEEQGVT